MHSIEIRPKCDSPERRTKINASNEYTSIQSPIILKCRKYFDANSESREFGVTHSNDGSPKIIQVKAESLDLAETLMKKR